MKRLILSLFFVCMFAMSVHAYTINFSACNTTGQAFACEWNSKVLQASIGEVYEKEDHGVCQYDALFDQRQCER